MQGKLNPQGTAKLNFPGFQEIHDFTAAGGEASTQVTVDGDTDKEYIIAFRNPSSSAGVRLLFNSDTGSSTNVGFQYLVNAGGSLSAARSVTAGMGIGNILGLELIKLLTPAGLMKTAYVIESQYTSGTTMNQVSITGCNWNSTANVTTLKFLPNSGTFTAGLRITVYARRSQS